MSKPITKGTQRQQDRRILRKKLNRATDPSSKIAHGYGNTYTIAEDNSK